ncbi:MAG: cupredoxin domain-containing protein [Thermoleophilaceae bacterium]|nr:cupredoxin domain-containing protein [Thermoleophilaceae bacterium]
MRQTRLIAPALISALALAAPAVAEDKTVDTTKDYEFAPKSTSIAVGDTVTWTFPDSVEHTATSYKGQPDKFDSGLKADGGTFAHTFDKPGKYQYFCRPHEDFMKGVITVGKDAVAKSFTKAAVSGGASSVKVALTLKEDAKVTLSVKGPKKKSVTKSLKKGKRTLTVKKLKAGTYKTTVTAQDAFDRKTTKKATAGVG